MACRIASSVRTPRSCRARPSVRLGRLEVAGRVERIYFDSLDKSDTPFANPRAYTILPSDNKVLTFLPRILPRAWVLSLTKGGKV